MRFFSGSTVTFKQLMTIVQQLVALLISIFSMLFAKWTKAASSHKCHDFTLLPFLCLLFHRQTDREGGRRKEKLMDKAFHPEQYCFKLSKSQCSVKGHFYISEVSTEEANRHFMFAVKNSFITTPSHQLDFLSSSDLIFFLNTADRSETYLLPPRNELRPVA